MSADSEPVRFEELFEGTNFGGQEKTDIGRRGLMSECILKRAAGYHCGFTITEICWRAGMLGDDRKPNVRGMRWAFDQLYTSSSPTILERLVNPDTHVAVQREECGRMPWDHPALESWMICGMNHYRFKGSTFLFVSMTKNGRCIKAEGPDIEVFKSLVKQAENEASDE